MKMAVTAAVTNMADTAAEIGDEPVGRLRDSMRQAQQQERQRHRDDTVNSRRRVAFYDDQTPHIRGAATAYREDIVRSAKRIQQKHGATEAELNRLKQAFMQSGDGIVTFLKVENALHSLIGILTSQQSTLQLLAAECCCNLALGDEKSCHVVARAATPYLLLHLQGCNHALMETSIWTLGNLCGGGAKAWELVRSQGLLVALLRCLEASETSVAESAAYALGQYVRPGLLHMQEDELETILQSSFRRLEQCEKAGSSCSVLAGLLQWVVYLGSCVPHSVALLQQERAMSRTLAALGKQTRTDIGAESVQWWTAAVRILANGVAQEDGSMARELLEGENWAQLNQVVLAIKCCGYRHLYAETSWLLGNLINHPNEEVQRIVTASPKCDELSSMEFFQFM